MRDTASFWTDIKIFEELLAKFPDSFCFARLSEVYLKVGLIDDALYVARQGIIKHPRYISGQRSLALACHAKGINDEALTALRLVTEAFPEDIASQKLFGRLSVESGNLDAACRAFRTALEFEPDDVECRIELESLERPVVEVQVSFNDEDDDAVIEDLEMLEEIDVLDEDFQEPEDELPETTVVSDVEITPPHDPLSTGTLAELYVKQGFIHKALDIYRAISADNPSDLDITGRIAELEIEATGPSEVDAEFDCTYEEEPEEEQFSCTPMELVIQETDSDELPESNREPALENAQLAAAVSGGGIYIPVVPCKGTADNAVATLDGWLENIRRIQLCR